MLFTSTRNRELKVNFSQAVHQCIPEDGGVFVPSDITDVRKWLYFIDENTPFSSIAGSLTSAFINDEFSPIICETIADDAFPHEPELRQLDDNLFLMELYHGFTGKHKDYGVSYLCSYLEYTLQLKGQKAVFIDFTHGGLGAVLANTLRGKKNLKAVLVYEKGTVTGLKEEDFVWNGGNIWPVETELSEAQIKAEIAKVFEDKKLVAEKLLTVANTTNVCRLFGQIFFYPFAFSRIKNKIAGDIYYAMDCDRYGTLMAGLYSWRFGLPLSGFIIPSGTELTNSPTGNPVLLDSIVELSKRGNANPNSPANIERLESFFGNNERMMRNFIMPVPVTSEDIDKAAKELFTKYGIFSDQATAKAYATAMLQGHNVYDEDGSIILMGYNHPALSKPFCRHSIGEEPQTPDNIKAALEPVELKRQLVTSSQELEQIIKEL